MAISRRLSNINILSLFFQIFIYAKLLEFLVQILFMQLLLILRRRDDVYGLVKNVHYFFFLRLISLFD